MASSRGRENPRTGRSGLTYFSFILQTFSSLTRRSATRPITASLYGASVPAIILGILRLGGLLGQLEGRSAHISGPCTPGRDSSKVHVSQRRGRNGRGRLEGGSKGGRGGKGDCDGRHSPRQYSVASSVKIPDVMPVSPIDLIRAFTLQIGRLLPDVRTQRLPRPPLTPPRPDSPLLLSDGRRKGGKREGKKRKMSGKEDMLRGKEGNAG